MRLIQNNLGVFIAVALIQLAVPAWMIVRQEIILTNGTVYRFKTAPVDPYDAFRGRYIALNFESSNVKVQTPSLWNSGDRAFAAIAVDSLGFAYIQSLSKEQPGDSESYVSVMVQYPLPEDTSRLAVQLPFNKFFVEESKAPQIEKLYNEMRMDSSKNTYAEVSIRAGKFALKGVFVDGKSILDIARETDAQ
ncbi:MAG: GDYXXLXY domain-containing protein [Saprospiraceae bacterium]|nr:GDYXXLXY domain-containing protein [Saprospiraceae bacterium]HMW40159.1 GDYXXLXY domain-containing protein [Saprospiraceae bacterium]HMX89358.1 GDYXXLXY domain-containing protein [Saprospiraceae bacterium]HMZ41323.1 GDYXXLXY domain-containing protein [Saprospiraceae bacterium]HNA65379.1 GDYXXLXY domain-containing protein [Saprospiraceae bacterium]